MATNRHTHVVNFRKCSHASVGIAQARPNYLIVGYGILGYKTEKHRSCEVLMK